MKVERMESVSLEEANRSASKSPGSHEVSVASQSDQQSSSLHTLADVSASFSKRKQQSSPTAPPVSDLSLCGNDASTPLRPSGDSLDEEARRGVEVPISVSAAPRARVGESHRATGAGAHSPRLTSTGVCERKDALNHRPESSAFRAFRVAASSAGLLEPWSDGETRVLSDSELPSDQAGARGQSHWVGLPALKPLAGPTPDAPEAQLGVSSVSASRAQPVALGASLLSQSGSGVSRKSIRCRGPSMSIGLRRGKPRRSPQASSITLLHSESDTINLCEPLASADTSGGADRGTALQKRRRRTKAEILAQWESGDRRLLWRCEVCVKILHRNMKKKHPCVKRLKARGLAKSTTDPRIDELLRRHAAEIHAKRQTRQPDASLSGEPRNDKSPTDRSGACTQGPKLVAGKSDNVAHRATSKRRASVDLGGDMRRTADLMRELEARIVEEDVEHELSSSAFFASLRANVYSKSAKRPRLHSDLVFEEIISMFPTPLPHFCAEDLREAERFIDRKYPLYALLKAKSPPKQTPLDVDRLPTSPRPNCSQWSTGARDGTAESISVCCVGSSSKTANSITPNMAPPRRTQAKLVKTRRAPTRTSPTRSLRIASKPVHIVADPEGGTEPLHLAHQDARPALNKKRRHSKGRVAAKTNSKRRKTARSCGTKAISQVSESKSTTDCMSTIPKRPNEEKKKREAVAISRKTNRIRANTEAEAHAMSHKSFASSDDATTRGTRAGGAFPSPPLGARFVGANASAIAKSSTQRSFAQSFRAKKLAFAPNAVDRTRPMLAAAHVDRRVPRDPARSSTRRQRPRARAHTPSARLMNHGPTRCPITRRVRRVHPCAQPSANAEHKYFTRSRRSSFKNPETQAEAPHSTPLTTTDIVIAFSDHSHTRHREASLSVTAELNMSAQVAAPRPKSTPSPSTRLLSPSPARKPVSSEDRSCAKGRRFDTASSIDYGPQNPPSTPSSTLRCTEIAQPQSIPAVEAPRPTTTAAESQSTAAAVTVSAAEGERFGTACDRSPSALSGLQSLFTLRGAEANSHALSMCDNFSLASDELVLSEDQDGNSSHAFPDPASNELDIQSSAPLTSPSSIDRSASACTELEFAMPNLNSSVEESFRSSAQLDDVKFCPTTGPMMPLHSAAAAMRTRPFVDPEGGSGVLIARESRSCGPISEFLKSCTQASPPSAHSMYEGAGLPPAVALVPVRTSSACTEIEFMDLRDSSEWQHATEYLLPGDHL